MSTMANCKVVNCGTVVRIDEGAVAIDGLEVIDCGSGIEQNFHAPSKLHIKDNFYDCRSS